MRKEIHDSVITMGTEKTEPIEQTTILPSELIGRRKNPETLAGWLAERRRRFFKELKSGK